MKNARNSMKMYSYSALIICMLTVAFTSREAGNIFTGQGGEIAVEAEHFVKQSKTDKRQWKIVTSSDHKGVTGDQLLPTASASGGSYIACVPDTRVTHDDELISGENFSNEPGRMAVLHYSIYFQDTGRYYVWVRAFSTGSEDNGLHVGLDGQWPESGSRIQWCEGKNEWTWASKQRTATEHCGVPQLIFLDIKSPGIHELQFSMREDGFRFDKFVLSKAYHSPQGKGPEPVIYQRH